MPSKVLTRALLAALLIAAPALPGCQNTLENTAELYPVLTGTVELRWEFEAAGVASVRYELDGGALGNGTDATRKFGLTFDTRSRANGAHKLVLTAVDTDGKVLRTFQTTIIIQNT